MSDESHELIPAEIMQEVMKEMSFSDLMGDALAGAMKKSIRTISDENKSDNIAIYVDYDNVYWTLMKRYNHDPNQEDPEKNLFDQIWKRYPRDKVRSFRAYADFEQVPTNLTSLQRKRVQIRHVYSNDRKGEERKNASDIEMCIDAIESTYKDPNIGCYVFVSADSDIIPILSRMMYKGKRVELLYLSAAAPQRIDMTSYAHDSVDLQDLLHIEVKEYDVESLVPDALKIIDDWNTKYGANKDYWLGATMVKGKFQKELSIPGDIASELLEYLTVNLLIKAENRQTSKGQKASYIVDNTVLTGNKEAAAGKDSTKNT